MVDTADTIETETKEKKPLVTEPEVNTTVTAPHAEDESKPTPIIRFSNMPFEDEEELKKKKKNAQNMEENENANSSGSADDDFRLKKNGSVREVFHRRYGIDIEGIEGVKSARTFDGHGLKASGYRHAGHENTIAFKSNDGQTFLMEFSDEGRVTIGRYKAFFQSHTSEATAAAMINVARVAKIKDFYLDLKSDVREKDVMWIASQRDTLKLIKELKKSTLDPETGNDALTGIERYDAIKEKAQDGGALTPEEKNIMKNVGKRLDDLKIVRIANYIPLKEAKLMKKFMSELQDQPKDVQEAFYHLTGLRAQGKPGMDQAADKAATNPANDASMMENKAGDAAKEQLALPPSPERKLLGMGTPLPDTGGGPSSKYVALPPGPETKALNSGYEGLDPVDAAWLKTMRDNLDKVRSGSSEPLTKPGAFNADSPAFKSFLQELGSQDKGVQEKFISEMKKVSGQSMGQIGTGQKALPEGNKPKQLGM